MAGDEESLISFAMVSLWVASIGFVFLRLVCHFMYTGEGVVCVCAGLSKWWRVRSPPPHVFKVASCFKNNKNYHPIILIIDCIQKNPFSFTHILGIALSAAHLSVLTGSVR